MAHNILDHLQILFIFTQPGTECVAQNVGTDVRERMTLPLFTAGIEVLFSVIVPHDPLKYTVNKAGGIGLSILIQKYKIAENCKCKLDTCTVEISKSERRA